jgi:hypothetical protein
LERNRWGLNTIGSGRKIEDLAAVFEIGKGTILEIKKKGNMKESLNERRVLVG